MSTNAPADAPASVENENDGLLRLAPKSPENGIARTPSAHAVHFENGEVDENDILQGDEATPRETFLPITRSALVDRLTRPQAWQAGQA